ncbi:hypothetical protein KVP10_12880 [Candidimonas humi]|uniref:Uncharacterized protein n=1 Tax=Candidimonas humi TaxID=683355 RepID=A0ABV8NTE7_9BURK|nr:hypothetical protein [Candidimonas humi]MBV6305785.1 hypothetical protein [Candidimonas humi]
MTGLSPRYLNILLIVVGWVVARTAARLSKIPQESRPPLLRGQSGTILQMIAILAGLTLLIWGVARSF